MTRSHAMTVTAAVLAGLAVPSVGIGAASAAPSHWETGTFEYGPEVFEDFCDVPGFTIEQQGVTEFRFRTTTHGPDGFSYDADFEDFTDTLTNVDTGESVTVVGSFQNNAHHVTDNGDGTLTLLVQGPGEEGTFNEAGERIFHRAGLTAFELLFDHAGTPTDPSDDEFLSVNFVKQTPGFDNDDFCAALIQAIG
jgi:hypothetical protein